MVRETAAADLGHERLTLLLPHDEKQALMRLATERRLTASALVRQLIAGALSGASQSANGADLQSLAARVSRLEAICASRGQDRRKST